MNNNGKRVLNRLGARELNREELARVAGAGTTNTLVITVNPKTGQRDGDG